MRVGLLYASDRDLNQSIREQVLGVRLAVAYSRGSWSSALPTLELFEEQVAGDPYSVEKAARELVYKAGCNLLLGALTVPLSIRAAEWAEAEGKLYLTSNNNPRVGNGRRCVFHIGVPSDITSRAITGYLYKGGKRRVYILHTIRDFQIHAADCMVKDFAEIKMAVQDDEIPDLSSGDRELLERVRAWKPDAICILGSETERIAELVKTAKSLGGVPSMLHPRGLLCREFAELAGEAGEGHEFMDIYVRDDKASSDEKALHRCLKKEDKSIVATASHGFGWDCFRLLASAWRAAGPDSGKQVAFLEGLSGYLGATGTLTFTKHDHNGRKLHDPTTIARLEKGTFRVVNTLNRN